MTSANGPGQDPVSTKPDHGPSSEDHTFMNYNDVALTSSQISKTPFSQRVEKLVAAHRSAAALTNSVTATEAERFSPVNNTMGTQVSLSNQCSNLSEPQLCPLPSSVSSRCPPTLFTSSISKMVMSDSTITVAASLSGTVRSRIAELEGRVVSSRI